MSAEKFLAELDEKIRKMRAGEISCDFCNVRLTVDTCPRCNKVLVRTFVLHDGEDEDKTQELHQFLAEADIHDWEGDEGGVYIYRTVLDEEPLHAKVGDTIAIDDEGGVTVRRKK